VTFCASLTPVVCIREEEEEEEEEVSVSRGKKRNKTFEKMEKKKTKRNDFTLKHKNSGYKYAKTHTSSVLR